ncbi:hypothetical protein [Litorivivens sp.]|uniref:hypothetical protein n=1 Tax=Litorivivens sp. TaxID=2020868 RepID=UPI003566BA17
MSKADQHSEALLGINLAQHGRAAKGSPPSDEELALLMEGGLSNERRSEVLSHLAARPDRYRQWLEFVEMAGQPAAETSLLAILNRGLNNWLIDWRYALGSFAVLGLTLFVFQATQQSPQSSMPAIEGHAGAPAPAEADMAAPPPAREQAAKRQAAEQQEAMAASESFTTSAKVCTSLLHPDSAQPGLLCSVAGSSGKSRLMWQARGEAVRHPLGSVHEKALQLRVSSAQNWVALQTAQAIYVQATADLFGENRNRAQLPFNSATATLAWEGEVLVISVMQALGDSDDDLKYRYLPESGELQPPL